jgi:hypothetical protein
MTPSEVALIVIVLLAVLCTAGYFLYQHFKGPIDKAVIDIKKGAEKDKPNVTPNPIPVTTTLVPTPVTTTLVPTPIPIPVTTTLVPTPVPIPAITTLVPTPVPIPAITTLVPTPVPIPAITTFVPTTVIQPQPVAPNPIPAITTLVPATVILAPAVQPVAPPVVQPVAPPVAPPIQTFAAGTTDCFTGDGRMSCTTCDDVVTAWKNKYWRLDKFDFPQCTEFYQKTHETWP